MMFYLRQLLSALTRCTPFFSLVIIHLCLSPEGGTQPEILSKKSQWARYRFLELKKPYMAIISAEGAPIYLAPGGKIKPDHQARLGTIFVVLAQSDQNYNSQVWYQVKSLDQKLYYVSGQTLVVLNNHYYQFIQSPLGQKLIAAQLYEEKWKMLFSFIYNELREFSLEDRKIQRSQIKTLLKTLHEKFGGLKGKAWKIPDPNAIESQSYAHHRALILYLIAEHYDLLGSNQVAVKFYNLILARYFKEPYFGFGNFGPFALRYKFRILIKAGYKPMIENYLFTILRSYGSVLFGGDGKWRYLVMDLLKYSAFVKSHYPKPIQRRRFFIKARSFCGDDTCGALLDYLAHEESLVEIQCQILKKYRRKKLKDRFQQLVSFAKFSRWEKIECHP